MAELAWGVLIIIDGEASGGGSVAPAHPDDPDSPRAFSHQSTPAQITIRWQPPLNWGNEAQPSGAGVRYYEIEYRRNTNPDTQTDEVSATSIAIPARGADTLDHFRIRAVNASGRTSHWVSLSPIPFDHPSRRYGRRYSRQYG